jgi:hypothetical protein
VGDGQTCTCPIGFELAGDICTACALGFYKPSVGNTACTACTGNSTTSLTGSDEIGDCTCSPGYFGNAVGSTCVACEPGTFKLLAGNGVVCSPCGSNDISTTEASTACTACADNSSPNGAHTECVCDAAYGFNSTGNLGCVICPANTFKSAAGNTACTNCTAGETSTQGSLS